jgi:hypothetical protein
MRLSAASREYSVELCPISSQDFEALMSDVLQLVALRVQRLLDGTDALELNGRHVETINHRRSCAGFCLHLHGKVM